MSLDIFSYNARTRDGEIVRGTVAAESPGAAALQLQRRLLLITSLRRASPVRRLRLMGPGGGLHAFFRAFSVLLEAGIAIRRAVVVAVECSTDPSLREALRGVLAEIEQGSTLSGAMARRPDDFSSLHTALIAAGETGGVLDQVLQRISDVLDREHAIRRKVQAALVYPLSVASGAGLLVIFLLLRVVPMFAQMFERLGVALPAPTRLLLWLSAVFVSPSVLSTLAGVALATILALTMKREWLASCVEGVILRLPLLGSLLRMAIGARVVRMLGILLHAGVGILSALNVVSPVAGSPRYGARLADIAKTLEAGDSIHSAMTKAQVFDPLTLALVAVGEEAGTLDQMLLAAGRYLDVEVEARLMTLTSALEPALIGLLGIVVAAIVFSIFLPLYSLIGSIS